MDHVPSAATLSDDWIVDTLEREIEMLRAQAADLQAQLAPVTARLDRLLSAKRALVGAAEPALAGKQRPGQYGLTDVVRSVLKAANGEAVAQEIIRDEADRRGVDRIFLSQAISTLRKRGHVERLGNHMIRWIKDLPHAP